MSGVVKPSRPSSLVFLEVSDPTLRRGKDEQRRIRSHVTRVQHQKRRESYQTDQSRPVAWTATAGSDASASSNGQLTPVSDCNSPRPFLQPASPPDAESEEPGLPFFNSSHPSQLKNSKVRRTIRSHVTKWQHQRRRKEAAETVEQLTTPPDSQPTTPIDDAKLPQLPISSSEKLISKGAAAIRNVILEDSTNTVATAITSLGLDLRSVMAHYYYMALDVHAPEFEAHSYCTKGLCQRVFLPFLFTDPALTCTIVLIAIIHRMSLMGIKQPPPEILHLRGFVIMSINQALQDPTRACSDQIIFAVANLAIFEAVFGSTEVYHVHMQGLSRMLRVRGGLPTLGFDGYLQKVLLWYDSNCASLVGCDPYLVDLDVSYQGTGMKPDAADFSGGLQVH